MRSCECRAWGSGHSSVNVSQTFLLDICPGLTTFKALHTLHISLTSCNITNLQGLCALPVFISFSIFLLPESWIHYISVSANLSHFLLSDVIKRHFTFSQPIPFQLPTLPRISLSMRPDSSKTLVLYKSCTYLLTLSWTFIPVVMFFYSTISLLNWACNFYLLWLYVYFGHWQLQSLVIFTALSFIGKITVSVKCKLSKNPHVYIG